MRATLAWSYELLDPATRAVFRWLAVFAGPFTLEAASVVCMGMDVAAPPATRIGDIFGRVGTLVDAHLLAVANREGGEPHLTMPALTRAFALERLRASGQEDEARRRHARYALTHGDVGDDAPTGQHHAAPLERDEDNRRAAIAWTVEAGEGREQAKIAGCGESETPLPVG